MVILPPVLGRRLVLFVADLLHPVDDLAVEVFLDRDVGHGGGRRRAMPVLLARRAPDDVARSNHFDRTTPALHEPAAGRDDQGLTQRMGVPRGPGAWLERDAGAARARRIGRFEYRVDAHAAGAVLAGSLSRPLGTTLLHVP